MLSTKLRTKAKRLLLKSLDTLPNNLGYNFYHQIQNLFAERFDSKYVANEKSYFQTEQILRENGFSIMGKNILEIGSGWMPIMPYFLHYKGGAKTTFTFDINDHYQNKYIDELNAYFENELNEKVAITEGKLHLPPFVKYHPHSNVITAPLPEKVDIIFSRFVLEHVTPADLVAMHERFKKEYGQDVLILHLISPSDHRAFSDSSVSHYDFLRYSDNEWNRIQTKFDYHNRLRLPQYLKLFDEAGMEVVYIEHDQAEPGSKKHDMFKQVPIHQDYAQFSEVELTAGSINVLLRPKNT